MSKQASIKEFDTPQLVIKEGRTLLHLKHNDIKWFKTEGNYTTIFLQGNKKRISRISLLELQQQLPSQFIRIHKSYMINKFHVTEIRTSRISIDNELIPIGRSYQKKVGSFLK